MNKSVECHGNDLEATLERIQGTGNIVESADTAVGGNPAMYRVNYFEAAPEREARAVADVSRTPKLGSNPRVATIFQTTKPTP